MGWADNSIKKLQSGQKTQMRPKGYSMSGIIESGDLVTLNPITDETEINKGDVVLCKVKGTVYLHLVKKVAVSGDDVSYLIGNNRGRENGWIKRNKIFGKVIDIEH